MHPDYAHYEVEDFVTDPYFNQWVKEPDRESKTFWKEWIKKFPEQAFKVKEARQMVTFLTFETDHPTPEEQEEVRKKIASRLSAAPQSSPEKHKPLRGFSSKWQMIAATVLLVSISWLVWHSTDSFQTRKIVTPHAQTREIWLPDSSRVILNANSSLTYRTGWDSRTDREVWLEGEAFFHILKKPGQSNARFTVHAANLNVEVLGTQFNVNTRHGNTTVVLNTGKIRLESPQLQVLTMDPGDLISLTKTNQLIRKQVNPAHYAAWKNNRLFFDNTTIRDITQLLEDNYGFQVMVNEPQILNQKFTGSCPADHLGLLFTAISETFRVSVEVQGKTIVIDKRKPI